MDAQPPAPAPPDAGRIVDEERGIAFRLAKASDVPAVRKLFDRTFPIKYDSRFYDLLEAGIDTGAMLGVSGKLMCAVAERDDGVLVGAVVMHTMNVSQAKAARQLTFDLVEGQRPETLAAYILLLAVDPASRRKGIGSDLIYHGSLLLGAKLSPAEGEALAAVSGAPPATGSQASPLSTATMRTTQAQQIVLPPHNPRLCPPARADLLPLQGRRRGAQRPVPHRRLHPGGARTEALHH